MEVQTISLFDQWKKITILIRAIINITLYFECLKRVTIFFTSQ